jgi:hypothetical protein
VRSTFTRAMKRLLMDTAGWGSLIFAGFMSYWVGKRWFSLLVFVAISTTGGITFVARRLAPRIVSERLGRK